MQISVVYYMGEYYVEAAEELESKGLKCKQDFYIFDIGSEEMALSMMPKEESADPVPIPLGVNWLEAHFTIGWGERI